MNSFRKLLGGKPNPLESKDKPAKPTVESKSKAATPPPQSQQKAAPQSESKQKNHPDFIYNAKGVFLVRKTLGNIVKIVEEKDAEKAKVKAEETAKEIEIAKAEAAEAKKAVIKAATVAKATAEEAAAKLAITAAKKVAADQTFESAPIETVVEATKAKTLAADELRSAKEIAEQTTKAAEKALEESKVAEENAINAIAEAEKTAKLAAESINLLPENLELLITINEDSGCLELVSNKNVTFTSSEFKNVFKEPIKVRDNPYNPGTKQFYFSTNLNGLVEFNDSFIGKDYYEKLNHELKGQPLKEHLMLLALEETVGNRTGSWKKPFFNSKGELEITKDIVGLTTITKRVCEIEKNIEAELAALEQHYKTERNPPIVQLANAITDEEKLEILTNEHFTPFPPCTTDEGKVKAIRAWLNVISSDPKMHDLLRVIECYQIEAKAKDDKNYPAKIKEAKDINSVYKIYLAASGSKLSVTPADVNRSKTRGIGSSESELKQLDQPRQSTTIKYHDKLLSTVSYLTYLVTTKNREDLIPLLKSFLHQLKDQKIDPKQFIEFQQRHGGRGDTSKHTPLVRVVLAGQLDLAKEFLDFHLDPNVADDKLILHVLKTTYDDKIKESMILLLRKHGAELPSEESLSYLATTPQKSDPTLFVRHQSIPEEKGSNVNPKLIEWVKSLSGPAHRIM